MIPTSKLKSNIYPWQVVQLMPDQQRQVVARFHRRNDANEYMRVLQRLQPAAAFELTYQAAASIKPDGEQG
jgi:hypothetical protein